MTSREAAIYHLKSLKGQPLKKKIPYILNYFWLPITAVLAAVIVCVSLIVHWTNQKPVVMTLCCVNSGADQTAVDQYLQGFADAQKIDTDEYDLLSRMMFLYKGSDADYQSAQVFAAMMISGDIDVLAANRATIVMYAYQDAFTDLNELLTKEQMETLSPYFLYMDMGWSNEMDYFSGESPEYPDPTKPEEMEKPVPVAITLQPQWRFTDACYPYTYGDDAIALVLGAANTENAKAFLQYVLGQEAN